MYGDAGEGYSQSGGYPGGTGGPMGDPNIGPSGPASHMGYTPHGVLGFGKYSPGGYNSTTFANNYSAAMGYSPYNNPAANLSQPTQLNPWMLQKKKKAKGGWPVAPTTAIPIGTGYPKPGLPTSFPPGYNPGDDDMTGHPGWEFEYPAEPFDPGPFNPGPPKSPNYPGGGSGFGAGDTVLGGGKGNKSAGAFTGGYGQGGGFGGGISGYANGGLMPMNTMGVVGERGPELATAGPGGTQITPLNRGPMGLASRMPPPDMSATTLPAPTPAPVIPGPGPGPDMMAKLLRAQAGQGMGGGRGPGGPNLMLRHAANRGLNGDQQMAERIAARDAKQAARMDRKDARIAARDARQLLRGRRVA